MACARRVSESGSRLVGRVGYSSQRGLSAELPETSGGLNRSMQHWLGVYSPRFQSPRSFAGVDLGAVEFAAIAS
jgi:hypothetical protein